MHIELRYTHPEIAISGDFQSMKDLVEVAVKADLQYYVSTTPTLIYPKIAISSILRE